MAKSADGAAPNHFLALAELFDGSTVPDPQAVLDCGVSCLVSAIAEGGGISTDMDRGLGELRAWVSAAESRRTEVASVQAAIDAILEVINDIDPDAWTQIRERLHGLLA